MAKTLGQQLDDVQSAIDAALSSQSYEISDGGNGRKLTRASLETLQVRENELIKKIEMFGRDYIPGQNTKPTKTRVNVVFY